MKKSLKPVDKIENKDISNAVKNIKRRKRLMHKLKLFFNKSKGILLVLCIAILIMVGLRLMANAEKANTVVEPIKTEKIHNVETAIAKTGYMDKELVVKGFTEIETVYCGYDRVQGQVKKIHVNVGDEVKKGDPLFSLNNYGDLMSLKMQRRDMDYQIQQLDLSMTQLQKMIDKYKNQTQKERDKNLELDKDIKALTRDYKQLQEKIAEGFSEEALNAIVAQHENTLRFIQAQQGLSEEAIYQLTQEYAAMVAGQMSTVGGSAEAQALVNKLTEKYEEKLRRQEIIVTTEAQTDEMTNQLELQKLQKVQIVDQAKYIEEAINSIAAYGMVRSPADGVISEIKMAEQVYLGQEDYIKITKQSEPTCVINVSENHLSHYLNGELVDVTIPSLKANVKGEVVKIEEGGGENLLYPVKIKMRVDEPIKAGLSADVKAKTYENDKAIVVPAASIIQFNDQTYVFSITHDMRVEKRIVEIGNTKNEMTEILSGLNKNDSVVTKGQYDIEDGNKVKIMYAASNVN